MRFLVSVDTSIGYRSGKSFNINADVILPNLSDTDVDEWSSTQYFTVLIMEKALQHKLVTPQSIMTVYMKQL